MTAERMRAFRFVIVLTAIVIGSVPLGYLRPKLARSEDGPCDPHLAQPNDEPQGYRLRGDRCEGLYIREVAGRLALLVVSFTESFAEFDAAAGKNLKVEWSHLGNEAVKLRAQGLTYRLHYRMDASRPSRETSYVWPSNLLGALGIGRQDIGIVGRTTGRIDGAAREIYLPLRIGQQGNLLRSPHYKVVLLPGEELKEVFLSLELVGSERRPNVYLQKDKPLGYSYYPAERPIPILLPELKAPGLYRLDVGATLARGGSTAETVWFYSSGE